MTSDLGMLPAAAEALNVALRDPRCGVSVRFGFANNDTVAAFQQSIRVALLAERERAAQIVADYLDHPCLAGNELALHIIAEITTAIRSQT